jgi:hypothetical protein
MPFSVIALLVALRSLIRSRLELQLENLALRHQIGVLQRSARKPLRLRSKDRFFWFYLEWSKNWNALKRRDVRLSQSPAAVSLLQVSPG